MNLLKRFKKLVTKVRMQTKGISFDTEGFLKNLGLGTPKKKRKSKRK